MKVRYRITCLLGAGAVLALGFAAGLITASPPAREDSAYERASAAATDIRVAVDAAPTDCDDACWQRRGVEAVMLLGNRPPQ
ncbi:hypothetical protein ACU4GI_01275 [Cupriavidus basilensis]|uniref:hypothetical protein n=1 Tax=Cupriavidus sp. TaxID=1873897 RepID=UPI003D0E7899